MKKKKKIPNPGRRVAIIPTLCCNCNLVDHDMRKQADKEDPHHLLVCMSCGRVRRVERTREDKDCKPCCSLAG